MTHEYLSTACLHAVTDNRPELHAECKTGGKRWDGTEKIPSHCKWCPDDEGFWVCECHREASHAA